MSKHGTFGAAFTTTTPKIMPVAISWMARENDPLAKFLSGEIIDFAGHGAVSGCEKPEVPLCSPRSGSDYLSFPSGKAWRGRWEPKALMVFAKDLAPRPARPA